MQESRTRAIIFDMDETLVQTGAIWRAAEGALLRHLGREWDAGLAGKYKGMNARDVAAVVHRELCPTLPVDECRQVMRDALLKAFEESTIRPMPGAVELVRRVATHWPVAVASGSPMACIRCAIGRCGLEDVLSILVTSEDVPRGKPEPDVFLRAAELLKQDPADCLVFEDSLAGALAARSAGMQCFVVPSLNPAPAELLDVATRVYRSWDEVTLAEITRPGNGSSASR